MSSLNTLSPPRIRVVLAALLVAVFTLSASATAQVIAGRWDEVVGKKVLNFQGVTLGHIKDTVIDLENGRYLRMVVSTGGFAGLGARSIIVPTAALIDRGTRGTLYVNMDEATFRQAPTFKMSKTVGPPDPGEVARVFQYFGQRPYFTTVIQAGRPAGQERLGYIQRGSHILNMRVENLQGKNLGTVIGLRDLNRVTGRLGGVIILPANFRNAADKKIVQPQALRYNPTRDRLRLNNHAQRFVDSPDFIATGGGTYIQESPVRPGNPPPPLVQSPARSDKDITARINARIQSDSSLSHYARTVEIATVKGRTTIHGRVLTTQARDKIIAYAVAAAGPGNVINRLEVRPTTAAEQAIDTVPGVR